MEEHLCTRCGASLRPTATYCLACDTVVVDTERGLSVGETQVVAHGRPLLGVGVVVAVLLVAAAGWWGFHHLTAQRQDDAAARAATTTVASIAHAEEGHAGACPAVEGEVVGPAKAAGAACAALFGTEDRAELQGLHAVRTVRHGSDAVVDLRGTWVADGTGTPFARTVHLVRTDDTWRVVWDGKALTAG